MALLAKKIHWRIRLLHAEKYGLLMMLKLFKQKAQISRYIEVIVAGKGWTDLSPATGIARTQDSREKLT